jgi:hypothetical protein
LRRRRRLRRIWTWQPETATDLPKTDLSKKNEINQSFPQNAAGFT